MERVMNRRIGTARWSMTLKERWRSGWGEEEGVSELEGGERRERSKANCGSRGRQVWGRRWGRRREVGVRIF